MTVMEKHNSKCSVFAFGFETCIETILPLINRLINKDMLVAVVMILLLGHADINRYCNLFPTVAQSQTITNAVFWPKSNNCHAYNTFCSTRIPSPVRTRV